MPEREFPPVEPVDVQISEHPWIGNTRVAQFFGPVGATGFIPYVRHKPQLVRSVVEFYPEIQAKAAALGANAIVGFELTFDPFAQERGRAGLCWTAVGTAARIEPLF